LDARGLEAVRKAIEPVLDLAGLRGFYDVAPNVTDQPQAQIYVSDGRREAATSVYGLMARGTSLPAFTRFAGGPKADALPPALATLHAWFASVDDARSAEWVPSTVEVMLWDYSYAPDASIVWPRKWPSLGSARAQKRGNSWSIFLDGSELPALRKFLASR